MITILIIIGILVLLVCVINYILGIANQFGLAEPLYKLEFFITYYCEKGHNNNILRLRDIQSKQSLDFVKLMPSCDGPTRFVFQLRSEANTKETFEGVVKILEAENVDYYQTLPVDKIPPRIIVDCGRDIKKAMFLAETVLVDFYGLSKNSIIRYGCIGPLDVRRSKVIGWGKKNKKDL